MIGRIRGTIIVKHPPHLLVEVVGIGYEIDAPMSTFYDLPEVGKEVVLHTHLAIKEDAHSLYGFATESERTLFRSLLKVSGIGAKTALAILSGASVDEFARLVQTGDLSALTRIPGIGKKTAERIVVEMRDRVEGLSSGSISSIARYGAPVPTDPISEATVALNALGYKPIEVSRLVKTVAEPGMSAEDIIRKALQASLRVSG
jgi:holliday junction DNA helicase RuvA